MARRSALPQTVAVRLVLDDAPEALAGLVAGIAAGGGSVRTLSTVRRLTPPVAGSKPGDPLADPEGAAAAGAVATGGTGAETGRIEVGRIEVEIEVEGLEEERLVRTIHATPRVRAHRLTRSLDRIFGKRVIVIGGGAQVAQVALGAVSEADRHNLRGERISVDTIALVGEQEIANAVRAVADLPRARLLVLAGSIMGGEITTAARELRDQGIPIICLNMAGSITDVADLVVSDPVQAGTMAVMAIADTATFDLARQRGRRF